MYSDFLSPGLAELIVQPIKSKTCCRMRDFSPHMILLQTSLQISKVSSCLTLKLFKSSLQLVVVEGSLAWESRARAGPPDGAQAGARTPAGAGVRWTGTTWRWGQGASIVHGWGEGTGGERAREATGGALKLHDETPERTKDLDEASPLRHRGDTQHRNLSFQFPVECKWRNQSWSFSAAV